MNSRRISHNSSSNNISNRDENCSSSMSIDEDSLINSHPLTSNKNLFNSFSVNRANNIVSNNIIKIPLNDNTFNTQQRPNKNFSIFPDFFSENSESYENFGKNSAFTSKKRKKNEK